MTAEQGWMLLGIAWLFYSERLQEVQPVSSLIAFVAGAACLVVSVLMIAGYA